jgi:hypothetical protein
MGLRNLSIAEMTEITGLWLSQQRQLFTSIPEIAGLLPHVEAAHAKLCAYLEHLPPNKDLSALISQERDLDRRHDHIYRAFYYLGKAWSEYVLSQEKVDDDLLERVQATIGTLLPRGMSSVPNPFMQEVGDARRVKESVSKGPGIRKTLSELRLTDNVAAVDMLESWFSLAEELGELERKKEQILTNASDGKIRTLNARVCRSEWMRIVTAVLTSLDHSTASQEKIQALRSPLDSAVQRSTIRYIDARRGKKSA